MLNLNTDDWPGTGIGLYSDSWFVERFSLAAAKPAILYDSPKPPFVRRVEIQCVDTPSYWIQMEATHDQRILYIFITNGKGPFAGSLVCITSTESNWVGWHVALLYYMLRMPNVPEEYLDALLIPWEEKEGAQ